MKAWMLAISCFIPITGCNSTPTRKPLWVVNVGFSIETRIDPVNTSHVTIEFKRGGDDGK